MASENPPPASQAIRLGSHKLIAGTRLTSTNMKSIMNIYGHRGLTTRSNGRLKVPTDTKIFSPNGGVSMPIAQFNTMIMPR